MNVNEEKERRKKESIISCELCRCHLCFFVCVLLLRWRRSFLFCQFVQRKECFIRLRDFLRFYSRDSQKNDKTFWMNKMETYKCSSKCKRKSETEKKMENKNRCCRMHILYFMSGNVGNSSVTHAQTHEYVMFFSF